MFIDATVWQMMRGSIIVFTAIFTVFFLDRKLFPFHWLGVSVTVCGLSAVGRACLLAHSTDSNAESSRDPSLGISLVIGAQLCSSFQMVFEEKLLNGYRLSAKKTVGLEGLCGCIMMTMLLSIMNSIPGKDHGVYEDAIDSLYMYTHSPRLSFLSISFMLSIACYNWFGLTVGKKLSAVTRVLVDTCRTIVVWLLQLVLFYCGATQYGESWNKYSWLQAVGFVLLICGTLIYNAAVRIPGMSYPVAPAEVPMWSPRISKVKGMDDSEFSPPNSPTIPTENLESFLDGRQMVRASSSQLG